ncbi:hypothetical protein BC938DRAFT_474815 [Jimgerdemannia flammicorona]|uniref:Uncharacterized protein n=1 Tax=Jimgerdemannia flammicorona TaxID=994334 RepID=A0A433QZJ7_9FUNG|nr:hypothetical protein BC938DRAFT_474815 [Jimgerdemannia flammicorona]
MNAVIEYLESVVFPPLILYSAITLTVLHIYNDHNINSNLPSFRYACFDHCDKDAQTYAFSTRFFLASSCEKQALSVLARLVQGGPNEVVAAEMNAMVVRDAEKYYRTMIGGGAQSWNQRDTHMLKMLEKIVKYEEKATGKEARAVVWPHNSHVGDARATDQGTDRHEVTIGQLAREKWWRAGVQHWIHHSYRDCYGFVGLGRSHGENTSQSLPTAELRAPLSLHLPVQHPPSFLSAPQLYQQWMQAHCGSRPHTGARQGAAGARDWCDLPSGDGADVALLRGSYGRAVRCGRACG